jgi:RHS repeat-associated protein
VGALKLTYYQRERALEKSSFFVVGDVEKSALEEKKGLDYYSFGSQMPQRNFTSSEYDYGFNGMEKDSEVKGEGNHYTTYWRQYDPRLGRWMSREPKPVAWESEYASFRNNPVYYADPNGDWVKGAGFWKNLTRSDNRLNAENRASKINESDPLANARVYKDDSKGWNVDYSQKATVPDDVKLDGVVMNREQVLENFNRKWSNQTVENAMQDYMRSGWILDIERNFPVDGRRKDGFKNGMTLLFGTWATILTAGQGTAAWGAAGTTWGTNALFVGSMASSMDNASTILYGNGDTFLSSNLPVSKETLNFAKFGMGGFSYYRNMKSLITLKNSGEITNEFLWKISFQMHSQIRLTQSGANLLKNEK